ncbi:MAG: ROK family protein [Candidatus Aureabacteria bacterium]|nr:ROK family protein [Candidatus Auribacterota bacterium]
MQRYAFGIDIGGTSAKIILADRRMRIAARKTVPIDPRRAWREALAAIADAACALGGSRRVAGAGVGCAGCIDAVRGVVQFSPNLPRWRNVPLAAFLARRLGAACVLDNDVNMMALGEQRYGAARGAPNVCCLTIGTGIGGGLIFEGRLYRGASMTAGELGHIPVGPGAARCPCGGKGCLERYVGRDGIVRLATRLMGAGGEALTPARIALAARAGDPGAREVWRLTGERLGLGLVCLVNLLNPDVVVIGGGISGAGRLLLDPARRVVRERALPIPARRVRIVRSALGPDAGAIGAASEAFKAVSR